MALRLIDFALLAAIALALAAAPLSKVEESFNLQACHDLLRHGPARLLRFDHLAFPGVVPRTFVGPLALSALAAPVVALAEWLAARGDGLAGQLVVRAALGLASWGALARVRAALETEFGARTAALFTLVSACQFHLPFYASRTLPNTFALVLCNLALAAYVARRWREMVVWYALAIALFRADVVVLFAPLMLLCWASGEVPVARSVALGSAVGLAAIAASVVIDSYFWRRWLWPEGEVLFFNTVLNRSSDWGVSPPLWYFTRALPMALGPTCAVLPLAAYLEPRVWRYLLPATCFVALYSLLPHKELRFVFPALPCANIAIACGLDALLGPAQALGKKSDDSATRPARPPRRLARVVVVCGLLAASAALAGGLLYVPSFNYPGGVALLRANAYLLESGAAPRALLHIDAAAAMSGVSLFLADGRVRTTKQEGLDALGLRRLGATHLLTANATVPGYRLVWAQDGFDRTALQTRACPALLPVCVRVVLADKVFFHEADGV